MPVVMKTFTGRVMDLLKPEEADINPVDIAHQLALINRYYGATFRPYSVAEHSVRVAGYFERERTQEQKFGLLHDASEAYIGDIHGQLKNTPMFESYRELEDRWMLAILIKFGMADLTDDVMERVRHADRVLLRTEQRDMTAGGLDQEFMHDVEPDRKVIEPWSWRTAEHEWLATFYNLFPTYR